MAQLGQRIGLDRLRRQGRLRGHLGCVVAGEHGDRSDDARAPIPDEFPGPRNPDNQQSDEEIADQLGSASAVRIQDEGNASGELECERQQEEGNQSDLSRHMAPWQMAGEDGPRPCGGVEDASIVWPEARGHIGATTGLGPGQMTQCSSAL